MTVDSLLLQDLQKIEDRFRGNEGLSPDLEALKVTTQYTAVVLSVVELQYSLSNEQSIQEYIFLQYNTGPLKC